MQLRRTQPLLAPLLLALLGYAPQIRANLIAFDPFDYPAGAVSGANGGTGFSAAWAAGSSFSVNSGNLSTPTYTGTGNDVQFSSTSSATMYRPVLTTFGVTGSDIWISYLTNPTSVSAYSSLELGAPVGSPSPTVGILGGSLGIGPASAFWGIDQINGQNYTSALSSKPISYGQTTLLVIHILGNVQHTVDLYVNPGATLPASPDASMNGFFGSTGQHFLTFQSNNANTLFDELRVGTTFADVAPAPEPHSLAILGIPVAALVARRGRASRRRRVVCQ